MLDTTLILFFSSEELEEVCVHWLSTGGEQCLKEDVVAKIWRSGHYPVTENIRRAVKNAQGERREGGTIRAVLCIGISSNVYFNGFIDTGLCIHNVHVVCGSVDRVWV